MHTRIRDNGSALYNDLSHAILIHNPSYDLTWVFPINSISDYNLIRQTSLSDSDHCHRIMKSHSTIKMHWKDSVRTLLTVHHHQFLVYDDTRWLREITLHQGLNNNVQW